MAKGRGKELSLPVTSVDPSTMLRASLTVEAAVEAFLKRDLSPNTFRSFRSDLTRFCRAYLDALVLRDLMGHRNIRTTLRYARVNPERTRQAFEEFDRRHTRKLPRGRGN